MEKMEGKLGRIRMGKLCANFSIWSLGFGLPDSHSVWILGWSEYSHQIKNDLNFFHTFFITFWIFFIFENSSDQNLGTEKIHSDKNFLYNTVFCSNLSNREYEPANWVFLVQYFSVPCSNHFDHRFTYRRQFLCSLSFSFMSPSLC